MQPKSSLFQRQSGGLPGATSRQAAPTNNNNAQLMERENEEVLRALREDVRALKGISGLIGREVQDQNKFLDILQSSMTAAKAGISSTMRKLDHVSSVSGVGHMWLLIIMVLVVCFFIYLLLKFR